MMTDEKKFFLLQTLLFALVICFLGNCFAILSSGDETRVAGISAEMLLTGNLLVPRLNGMNFLEYPGLYYWVQVLCVKLFGYHETSMTLASSLSAFASALLICFFAQNLKVPPRGAFFASVIFLTGAQVFMYTHRCMVDIQLVFFIGLAMYGFWNLFSGNKIKRNFLLFVLGLSGGILTKGLIGALMPCAAAFSFLALSDLLDRKISLKKWGLLITAAFLGWIPWVIWVCLIYKFEGYNAFYTAVWTNNFGRFFGTQGDHCEPVWYYLGKIPVLFQPWMLFFLTAFVLTVRKIFRERRKEDIFLAITLAVPFLMLSAAAAKRQVYLLPLTVYASMLTGRFMDRLADIAGKKQNAILLTLSVLLTAAGSILLFVLPVLSVPQMLCAGLSFFRTKYTSFLRTAAAALLLISIFAVKEQREAASESLAPLFHRAAELQKQGYILKLCNGQERTKGAAVFYLKERLPDFPGKDNSPKTVLIVRDRPLWEKYAGGEKNESDWNVFATKRKGKKAVFPCRQLLAGAVYADFHVLMTVKEYQASQSLLKQADRKQVPGR